MSMSYLQCVHCWVYSEQCRDVPDLSQGIAIRLAALVCVCLCAVGSGAFILGKEGISLVRVGIGMVVIAPLSS